MPERRSSPDKQSHHRPDRCYRPRTRRRLTRCLVGSGSGLLIHLRPGIPEHDGIGRIARPRASGGIEQRNAVRLRRKEQIVRLREHRRKDQPLPRPRRNLGRLVVKKPADCAYAWHRAELRYERLRIAILRQPLERLPGGRAGREEAHPIRDDGIGAWRDWNARCRAVRNPERAFGRDVAHQHGEGPRIGGMGVLERQRYYKREGCDAERHGSTERPRHFQISIGRGGKIAAGPGPIGAGDTAPMPKGYDADSERICVRA